MALYIFFDEGGDFNFSPGGTRYFHFGALTMRHPGPLNIALTSLRYELIEDGLELERFHCAEDNQRVRDRVFERICTLGGFDFDTVVVEKRKVHPSLYDPLRFYPTFSEYLLRRIFHRHLERTNERIVIITDRLPVKRKEKAAEKAFKVFLRRNLGDHPFTVMHNASAAHPGLQAADYCNWAVYRKWRDDDLRSYELIRKFIRSENAVFLYGMKTYY